MTTNTKNAIINRISSGEDRFFIGRYWYEANIDGILRRREQRCGYTPTSDWERVGSWNPMTGAVEFC